MGAKTLAEKMKLRPGQRIALVNAPDRYLEELGPLPDGVETATALRGKFDWVQVFVQNQAEINRVAPKVTAALKAESLLWISFPKGSSKIQTDLTRDKGWDVLHTADLKWVNLISVNAVWSAFALRPYRPGEARTRWWS